MRYPSPGALARATLSRRERDLPECFFQLDTTAWNGGELFLAPCPPTFTVRDYSGHCYRHLTLSGCFDTRFRVERLFCRCFDAGSAC